MDERREVEREVPVVERERTTIINTGGGGDRGGGGALLAIVLLIVLLVVAFLVFGRDMLGGGDTDVKIDVKAPDIDLPAIPVPGGNQSK